MTRPAFGSWAEAAEANGQRRIGDGRREWPCGHVGPAAPGDCPTCERLQLAADAAEDAANAARRAVDE